MAAVLVAWLLLAVLLVGLGLLIVGGPRVPGRRGDRAFTAFWLGYLIAIAFLQVWHLVAPVTGVALAVLALPAALGLALHGREVLRWLRGAVTGHPVLTAACVLLPAWLANRALGPPVGDAGIYHLSFVRWFTAYPIVPGLANLHGRLGFNNPSLLWSAMLEVGPWYGRSSHLAVGLLVLALGIRSLAGLARCLRPSPGTRPVDLLAAALMPVVVAHAVTLFELRLSSPDPDSSAALVAIAAALHLAAFLTDGEGRGPGDPLDVLAATSLAVLAACLKVSLAPFAVALVLVALGARRARDGRPVPIDRLTGAWLAATLVLVVPWLIRGVVLSGYPLFPAQVLPVPVDWRMPAVAGIWRAEGVDVEVIRETFMPPAAMAMRSDGQGWLRAWLTWQLTRIPELVLLPTVLCCLGLVGLSTSRDRRHRAVLWMLVPSVVSVAAWLASAPHPRFAYGPFWIAAGASITAGFFGDLARPGSRRRALLLVVLVGAALFPLVHRVAAWAWIGDHARAIQSVVLDAGPDHGFHPTPTVPLRLQTTRSGLGVNVPWPGEDKVWDAPLPATPCFKPGTALRRTGDLGGGFRLAP